MTSTKPRINRLIRAVGVPVMVAFAIAMGPAVPALAADIDFGKLDECIKNATADFHKDVCCIEAGGQPVLDSKTGNYIGCVSTSEFNPQQPDPIVSGGPGHSPDQPNQPPKPVVVKPGGTRA